MDTGGVAYETVVVDTNQRRPWRCSSARSPRRTTPTRRTRRASRGRCPGDRGHPGEFVLIVNPDCSSSAARLPPCSATCAPSSTGSAHGGRPGRRCTRRGFRPPRSCSTATAPHPVVPAQSVFTPLPPGPRLAARGALARAPASWCAAPRSTRWARWTGVLLSERPVPPHFGAWTVATSPRRCATTSAPRRRCRRPGSSSATGMIHYSTSTIPRTRWWASSPTR